MYGGAHFKATALLGVLGVGVGVNIAGTFYILSTSGKALVPTVQLNLSRFVVALLSPSIPFVTQTPPWTPRKSSYQRCPL